MLQTPVEEFTTPNPVTAAPTATIDELELLMKKHGVRHLPIAKAGKVVGILSDRDIKLVKGLSQDLDKRLLAEDIMTSTPVSVNCSDPLDEVALTMSENKIGSVLVYDEDDEFMGIFTSTDALNALVEVARELKMVED